ncbi:glutaredoxin domain-containing protein [Nocardia beijingensis]
MPSRDVELYMHGTPDHPRTAHSLLACRMLAYHSVTYTAYDVLTDQHARRRAETASGVGMWPQVFADGEYLGGTEVLCELLRSGQLRPHRNAA